MRWSTHYGTVNGTNGLPMRQQQQSPHISSFAHILFKILLTGVENFTPGPRSSWVLQPFEVCLLKECIHPICSTHVHLCHRHSCIRTRLSAALLRECFQLRHLQTNRNILMSLAPNSHPSAKLAKAATLPKRRKCVLTPSWEVSCFWRLPGFLTRMLVPYSITGLLVMK